jgi:hypothetical protein
LLLPVGRDRHSPGHKQKKAESPKLLFRGAGMQVSPVTMSCPSLRASAPPCLLLFIKGLLKEDIRFFGAFGLGFGFWPFAFGFLVWEAFGKEKNY